MFALALAVGQRLLSSPNRSPYCRGMLVSLAVLLVCCLPARASPASRPDPLVIQMPLVGTIGPGEVRYLRRVLDEARMRQAALVLIQLDTPGGLMESTRQIIEAMLASPVPVAIHVAPSGAHAASAGTFLVYAAHLAVMAPGTTLGAATPVSLGGNWRDDHTPRQDRHQKKDPDTAPSPSDEDTMSRKVLHDAVALIRSLAQLHGRNQQWAERFVQEAVTLTAQEALREGVIDLLAVSPEALFQQAEGRTVHLATGPLVLHLERARLVALPPTWHERLLMVLGNPQLAYILLLVGFYGLIMEFIHPGTAIPGTVGAIALLLAFYALQVLPVSLAGIGLLLLGILLLVAEGFAPGFGILGLGGVVSFVLGSVMFLDQAGTAWSWSQGLVIGAGLGMALLVLGLAVTARRIQRRGMVTGDAALLGSQGIAIEDFTGTGVVRVRGELWQAHSTRPVSCGQHVVIKARQGLLLLVEPLEENMLPSAAQERSKP